MRHLPLSEKRILTLNHSHLSHRLLWSLWHKNRQQKSRLSVQTRRLREDLSSILSNDQERLMNGKSQDTNDRSRTSTRRVVHLQWQEESSRKIRQSLTLLVSERGNDEKGKCLPSISKSNLLPVVVSFTGREEEKRRRLWNWKAREKHHKNWMMTRTGFMSKQKQSCEKTVKPEKTTHHQMTKGSGRIKWERMIRREGSFSILCCSQLSLSLSFLWWATRKIIHPWLW